MNEGTLHKWFKGSKSKDGKGGWVNVVTGGTCASDKPGEGTPKCVSSSKRASMTKAERLSASRRKKKADPNQQAKSGAAKPTYVSTDKPKKKMKEELEYIDLPLEVEIPSNLRDFNKGLMFRESLENDKGMLFIFERVGQYSFYMKNTTIPLDVAFVTEEGIVESIKSLEPNDETAVSSDGQILFAIEANRGWFAENNVEVGDEIVLGEAKDKKGKGSGTKDACYHKVKSRYSVWPSAYASGALVKCRKKGAANWGEEYIPEEGYDHWRDKQLERGTWKSNPKKSDATTRPVSKEIKKQKGKTVYQKEAEKKYGKGATAFDIVKAKIKAKHGDGAIMGEDVKRDEYGDPIGGPKISKKQKKKNLASNEPDMKITRSEEIRVKKPQLSDWRNEIEIDEGKGSAAIGGTLGNIAGKTIGGMVAGPVGHEVGKYVGGALGAAALAKKGKKGRAAAGGALGTLVPTGMGLGSGVGAALAASHQPEGDMVEGAGSTIGGAVVDTVVKDSGVAKEIGGIASDAIRDKRNLLRKLRREKPLPPKVNEAKMEGGYISNVGKAEVRNQRRFGKKGSPEPQGYFGQKPSEKAQLAVKRGEEHKARRGVKTKGVREEIVSELKNSTLLSYTQKATNDLAFSGDGKKKAQKRATGIKSATGKLAIRATDPDGSLGFNKNVKNEEVITERQKTNQGHRQSEEQHRSDYGKASVRNVRATGMGGNAADPAERGAAIDTRHKAHKEKRGVKTRGIIPTLYDGSVKEEVLDERVGGAGTLVRQGVKVGGKKGGRAVQAGQAKAIAAGQGAKESVKGGNKSKMVGSGRGEKIGAVIGGTAGALAGGIVDGPVLPIGDIIGGIAGGKVGGKIGRQFDKMGAKKSVKEGKNSGVPEGIAGAAFGPVGSAVSGAITAPKGRKKKKAIGAGLGAAAGYALGGGPLGAGVGGYIGGRVSEETVNDGTRLNWNEWKQSLADLAVNNTMKEENIDEFKVFGKPIIGKKGEAWIYNDPKGRRDALTPNQKDHTIWKPGVNVPGIDKKNTLDITKGEIKGPIKDTVVKGIDTVKSTVDTVKGLIPKAKQALTDVNTAKAVVKGAAKVAGPAVAGLAVSKGVDALMKRGKNKTQKESVSNWREELGYSGKD